MRKILEKAGIVLEADPVEEEICQLQSKLYYRCTVKDGGTFVIYDDESASALLQEYRDVSILTARESIPDIFHDYMDFEGFANDTWPDLASIYDNVKEVEYNNRKYYVCLI